MADCASPLQRRETGATALVAMEAVPAEPFAVASYNSEGLLLLTATWAGPFPHVNQGLQALDGVGSDGLDDEGAFFNHALDQSPGFGILVAVGSLPKLAAVAMPFLQVQVRRVARTHRRKATR